ncbi:MAG TPA: trypsin-like peptidase domain-containing protein [Vicinamibacterales bacterium]|nr:trypsin-like peptidase domain-containing protein [Vicinamibacterales bacterium]
MVTVVRAIALCALVVLCTSGLGRAQGSAVAIPSARAPGRAVQTHAALASSESRARATHVDLPPVAARELSAAASRQSAPMLVGFPRSLPGPAAAALTPEHLRWTPVASGQAASVMVRSPGAAALRLALLLDRAPAGTQVRFFGRAGQTVYGPYAAADMLAANPFWSPVIEGDAAGIEFVLPTGAAPGELRFSVPQVSHLLGSIRSGWRNVAALNPLSGSCETDIACGYASTWGQVASGVAEYLFTDAGATYLCSGTLMNDNDAASAIPYFLTANHCVGSQAAASTIHSYWFYQSQTCGGGDPSDVVELPDGATLLATGDVNSSDFSFLRLNDPAPGGAAFAGWSTAAAQPGEAVVGIHHPEGDYTKISFGTVIGLAAWGADATGSGSHIEMRWSSGVTEPGSSGSGLFRSGTWPNQPLIGLLTGGGSSCEAPASPDWYGRFDLIYPHISAYLYSPLAPAAPTLVSPTGTITTATPTFVWNAVTGATSYALWVDDTTATRVKQSYSAAQAGCASGSGVCAAAPGVALVAGSARFWVQASNFAAASAWSAAGDFTVSLPPVETATVLALYPVVGATQGTAARLWAHVSNSGTLTFAPSVRAWLYVDGPGWTGDHWVGASSLAGLAAGSAAWTSFDWRVPSSAMPGSYSYAAYIYDGGRISGSSPSQVFTVAPAPVPAATVLALYPVNSGSVPRAGSAILWAHVRNTGTVPLPAGAAVWFFVDGPSWSGSHWVGSAPVSTLAPGQDGWFPLAWPVAANEPTGAYTYWAQVWAGGAISPWSVAQSFVVVP